ncbi:hypothetical protein Pint_00021 [Pistacia integerrima]|uniref:Uncharacterized protein n=1 Tax=Pistacia integerrima TaxID=434235 RepID=A0ACC0ZIG5_9ROSI|nr:hypothetical protein Pint_00021 [Pistacia integerrima]
MEKTKRSLILLVFLQLVFYVFSPALISSYLADTITLQSLTTLWFIPVNILLTFIIGSALGSLVMKITRTPEQLRGLVISCCSADYVTSKIVLSEIHPPALHMQRLMPPFLWRYDQYVFGLTFILLCGHMQTMKQATQLVLRVPEKAQRILLKCCFQAQRYQFWKKIKERVSTFVEKINIKKILAASTIAATVGLTIGIVSPIRKAIIGDSAPLGVIYTATSLLGYNHNSWSKLSERSERIRSRSTSDKH